MLLYHVRPTNNNLYYMGVSYGILSGSWKMNMVYKAALAADVTETINITLYNYSDLSQF
jgi:hypothetical protein